MIILLFLTANLKTGDVWKEEIYQAIEQTDFFLVCLSKAVVDKTGFIQNEIRTAINEYQRRPHGSKYLLPIKLEPCQIPRIRLDSNMLISDLQWIEIFEGDNRAQKRLADDIWTQWKTK